MTENDSNSHPNYFNYFVCTLDEAAIYNTKDPHPFATVNDFVDYQSNRIPHQPAVAFPIPSQDPHMVKEWDHSRFSALGVYR